MKLNSRAGNSPIHPFIPEGNMVITESIQKAIQAAVRKSGSMHSFSHDVGVSHTTIAYWIKGRTRKINSTVWQNLLPYLKDYLDPAETVTYPCGAVPAGNANPVLREQPVAFYGAESARMTPIPLLRLADLAEFDPQIDSAEELIRDKARGTAVFTSPARPGYFAVEVDESGKGFFPAGTRLLLRWPDAPADGDTVLVKFRNKKDFLIAAYSRGKDGVELTPLQKGGRKRVIPKAAFHNVCRWIVSIREAVQLF